MTSSRVEPTPPAAIVDDRLMGIETRGGPTARDIARLTADMRSSGEPAGSQLSLAATEQTDGHAVGGHLELERPNPLTPRLPIASADSILRDSGVDQDLGVGVR